MKKLSLIEIAFFLKNTSLFEDLELDLVIAIADKMHQDLYDKKEIIFEKDQIASKMYFIAKGSVNILDEKKNIIKTLKKNDFLGDESVFNNKPRAYCAICSEDSLILSLNKTNLHTIIMECPSVAISLLTTYSQSVKNRWEN